ncbi:MAG TPA: hypothetical protein VK927_09715, partial [Adhaeribacter sp.]|nr:hypothetical protein [Adhaeribacter sp.]
MTEKTPPGFAAIAASPAITPKESMLAIETKRRRLFIGIPKESSLQENRIGLTPAAVKQLTDQGHRILFETGAGEPSKYSDHDFSEAGAEIVYATQEVYEADIILKIAPPTYDEMEYLKANQTLISALQFGSLTADYILALCRKKI